MKYRNTIIYKTYRKLAILIFRLLPIKKNKIVFDNFCGRGYGDDPKYIAEGLLQLYPNQFELIWFVKNSDMILPERIKPIKYGTLRAAYQMATAKVWVDNVKNSFKVDKRQGQYYIQTWHSTLGLKYNEADAESLSSEYVMASKRDAAMTDLMYSNNDFRYNIYKKSYWYNGEVIKCGVPRNTILINKDERLIEKIYSYFQIDRQKKIVLYAPTFRKEWNPDVIGFSYEKVCKTLEKQYHAPYVCMVRLHPNDNVNGKKLQLQSSIINVTDYPDIQELLAVANILITDYSAIMFDFSFAYKPVFLLMKDYEKYINQERKLHFTFDELPYVIATDEDMLIKNIETFSSETYNNQCKQFFSRIGLQENGDGVQRITEIIYKKCYNDTL